ncbi:MAG: APC family permease [Gammaproteobacteria bacterium]|nr:APC family permease [Gammaproteobacteria bacterium]
MSAPRLGPWQLFSASIGVIVAQIGMVSLTQGMGLGGWGFLLALVIAFAIALANALAYAEMALLMPGAASLASYAEAALGDFPAILVVFAGYVTPAIFGLPAELILADQILRATLPIPMPVYGWPVLIVGVFAVLNILGTDVFARIQTALSFTVLVFLLVTGLVAITAHGAFAEAGSIDRVLGLFGNHTQVLGLIALAFWVFVGSEFVTPLVPEAAHPERDLPRAMIGGLATIFLAQLVFAVGSAFVVPRAQLASSGTPHWDYAIATFGPSARVWFAGLAVIATASLINTVLAAVPRMLAGMAENGQAFPVLKVRLARTGTPIVAILFVAALPLTGLVWSHGEVSGILPLMIAAATSWLLAYMLAQVSLMILRYRYPTRRRPFRVPGHPLVPVLALIGMGYVIVNSAPTPEMAPLILRYVAIVLAVFATVGCLWVKLVMKKGLFAPSALAPESDAGARTAGA